jgi:hypothetical protein
MTRRGRLLGFGGAAALVVFAAVLAAVGDGAADVAAVALGGVGSVLAVSLAFLEVGLWEDRDRAAEEAEARRRREARRPTPRASRPPRRPGP